MHSLGSCSCTTSHSRPTSTSQRSHGASGTHVRHTSTYRCACRSRAGPGLRYLGMSVTSLWNRLAMSGRPQSECLWRLHANIMAMTEIPSQLGRHSDELDVEDA